MIASFASQIQSRSKRENPGCFKIPCISSTPFLNHSEKALIEAWSIDGSICETWKRWQTFRSNKKKVKNIQMQFAKKPLLVATVSHPARDTASSSDSECPTMQPHHPISVCSHTFAPSETVALEVLSTSFHRAIFYSPWRLSWGVTLNLCVDRVFHQWS